MHALLSTIRKDDTPPGIYLAVVQNINTHTAVQFVLLLCLVVVVSFFVVWLVEIYSACMHPPEDDAPGIYQTVAQKILTKQRSFMFLLFTPVCS
jgi:uncharacterized membrane protein SpoIIM required for sporulation